MRLVLQVRVCRLYVEQSNTSESGSWVGLCCQESQLPYDKCSVDVDDNGIHLHSEGASACAEGITTDLKLSLAAHMGIVGCVFASEAALKVLYTAGACNG